MVRAETILSWVVAVVAVVALVAGGSSTRCDSGSSSDPNGCQTAALGSQNNTNEPIEYDQEGSPP